MSAGEITSGIETSLRSVSPADIVAFVDQHSTGGGGGGGGLTEVDNAGNVVTLNQSNFGQLITFTSDSAVAITLAANTTVPGSDREPSASGEGAMESSR